jgi:hypothetical protein
LEKIAQIAASVFGKKMGKKKVPSLLPIFTIQYIWKPLSKIGAYIKTLK